MTAVAALGRDRMMQEAALSRSTDEQQLDACPYVGCIPCRTAREIPCRTAREGRQPFPRMSGPGRSRG
ncbi:hypothetical protein [Streptomyces sulphureus]|uniref:hypothetical protein n=1 Tax=Streptomyces sulphureus TaxID=47758 RepID=UPI000364DB3C|nr:hypothetical protein [Streptomyces sulphureus]